MTTRILGINAFHADASAVALAGGAFVTGVEEERFRRVKHWAGFPEEAVRHCLAELGAGLGGLDAVAVSRQPRAYLARKAWLALTHPRSLGRAAGRARNLAAVASLESRLAELFGDGGRMPPIHPVEHHLAHLASAFFCSPFEEAMCLSVDGFGDFVSTMLATGRGPRLDVLERVHFPHSLGLFYTAITQFLGFVGFGDEYKVMGLAAYGEPRYAAELRRVVPALEDGTFRLDLAYFRHLSEGVDMSWDDGSPTLGLVYTPALAELLGPTRGREDDLTQRHKDLAASLQQVYEERFFALVRALQARTGLERLALAGGCALNSLANGKLFDRTDVKEIYVQAAAGDAGTALGAALYVEHAVLGRPRGFVMEHSYWGPAYGEAEVRRALVDRVPGSESGDGRWGEVTVATVRDEERLARETAAALAAGEVVGWYQGRSEWGPRALGNRSILADPRRPDMKEILNRKIKRRESFRPFAPSVLEEATGDWFTLDYPDPFMLKVYPIRPEKRAAIPAVTHADGTGRLQTVSREANPRYHRLISAFAAATGVPMVLNTSFNENEPIVNRPEEAIDCFLRTRMDRLVLGDVVVTRVPPPGGATVGEPRPGSQHTAGTGAGPRFVRGRVPSPDDPEHREMMGYESGAAEEVAARLGGDAAESWVKVVEQHEPGAHRAFHQALADPEIASRVRGRVIDLGAGSGWATAFLSKLDAVEEVVALDLSEQFLRRVGTAVIRHYEGRLDKVTFAASSFEAVPFEAGSFDAAFLIAAIHHSLAPIKVLLEIRRVLKPGGVLVVIESPSPLIHIRRQRANALELSRTTPTTEITYTRGELEYLLRHAGFQRLRFLPHLERSRNPVKRWVRLALRAAGYEDVFLPVGYVIAAEQA